MWTGWSAPLVFQQRRGMFLFFLFPSDNSVYPPNKCLDGCTIAAAAIAVVLAYCCSAQTVVLGKNHKGNLLRRKCHGCCTRRRYKAHFTPLPPPSCGCLVHYVLYHIRQTVYCLSISSTVSRAGLWYTSVFGAGQCRFTLRCITRLYYSIIV